MVLSRKRGEKILVGEGANQIEITIVDIRGDKTRIGIEAAREIPIHRSEVRDKIDAEQDDSNSSQ